MLSTIAAHLTEDMVELLEGRVSLALNALLPIERLKLPVLQPKKADEGYCGRHRG